MTKRLILPFLALITLSLVSIKNYAQPIASFVIDSPYTFCNPIQVPFTSTSTGNGLSYSWNFGVVPGVNDNTANPIYYYFGCGTFTVTLTVTDKFGNTSTTTQPVTIHCTPFAAIGMGDSTVCPGTTVNFKDYSVLFNPTVTWNWNFGDPSSGQNTSTLEDPKHVYNKNGTYTIEEILTSSYGCVDSAFNTETVIVNSGVNAGPDITICSNSPGQLEASGSSKYTWSPSTGLSSSTVPNPVVHANATTTYTVTAIDNNGCTGTNQAVVTVITKGISGVTPNQTVCTGSSADLSATGLKTYSWSPSTGLSATNISNPIATPASTQSYVVDGQDNNGCTVTDTVVVYVEPVPTANAGANITSCSGDEVNLVGSGGNSFKWLPQTPDLQNGNSYNATAYPTQNTTYTLIVSNGGNCTATSQVVVTVNAKPIIISSSVVYCPGSPVQLNASGAVSYTWLPATALNQTDIPNPLSTPISPVTYTVTGIGSNGCSATVTVTVDKKVPLNIIASPGGTICPGEQLQLYASGALTYQWFPQTGLDNPYIPTPYASPQQSITYKVKGSDGCYFDSAYSEVKVNNTPPVNAGPDLQTFADNPVHLSANGTGSFTWTPSTGLSCSDCPDPTATVQETTTYVVSLVNTDGCRTEDTVVVYVNCSSDLIFIPNAFTPNGDGKNDKFYIRTLGLKSLEVFKVFNRTGECVFETNSVDNGWDGTYHGEKLPPGVFAYYGEATCSQNQKVTFTGNVTLIR